MTRAELEAERDAVSTMMAECTLALAGINEQINGAKSHAATGGEYSDPDWWVRVNSARRHRAREHQELQLRLGKINREIRDLNRVEFTDTSAALWRVAKAALKYANGDDEATEEADFENLQKEFSGLDGVCPGWRKKGSP